MIRFPFLLGISAEPAAGTRRRLAFMATSCRHLGAMLRPLRVARRKAHCSACTGKRQFFLLDFIYHSFEHCSRATPHSRATISIGSSAGTRGGRRIVSTAAATLASSVRAPTRDHAEQTRAERPVISIGAFFATLRRFREKISLRAHFFRRRTGTRRKHPLFRIA